MKKLSFINGPRGDIASFYRGPADMGADDFPLVILSHGFGASTTMGESARLFYNFALDLSQNGIAALMHDFSGHGLSDGTFDTMTPNTRLADLATVTEWALARHSGPVFLLGLSMGAAVSIHVAEMMQKKIKGLVTWSAVPSFDPASPSSQWFLKNITPEKVDCIGDDFLTDRPGISVGEAYKKITIPKLQVQGDNDYPFFAEGFSEFYKDAPEPKDYIVIPDADHTFYNKLHREELFKKTVAWLLDKSR